MMVRERHHVERLKNYQADRPVFLWGMRAVPRRGPASEAEVDLIRWG